MNLYSQKVSRPDKLPLGKVRYSEIEECIHTLNRLGFYFYPPTVSMAVTREYYAGWLISTCVILGDAYNQHIAIQLWGE
jgi:hypothetical protein